MWSMFIVHLLLLLRIRTPSRLGLRTLLSTDRRSRGILIQTQPWVLIPLLKTRLPNIPKGYFGIEIHGPFETIPNNERAIFMRNSDYPESLFFKTNENEATRAVIVQPWGEVRYIAQHSLMMKQIV